MLGKCQSRHHTCKEIRSFIGPGSEKKWSFLEENSPQGIRDHIAEKMLLEFAENGHPIFGATTPLSRWNLKTGHVKLSIHYCADQKTIETFSQNGFCQSAQSLRSTCKHVWRIWEPSRSIGWTWCIDGTINCSQWNQGRSSFEEWNPVTSESSIATVWRTNQIAFTRKQSE